MKHFITLCLTVFFIAGTQNAQAQTKEETIQWLNDYGRNIKLLSQEESYKERSYRFSGYDGEFLHFKDKSITKYKNDGTTEYETEWSYKIDPKDILYVDISSVTEDSFYYYDLFKYWGFEIKAKPKTVLSTMKRERYWTYGVESQNENYEESTMHLYLSKDQQKDAIRLIKAIMNLAKLSGASELPKVTENTF